MNAYADITFVQVAIAALAWWFLTGAVFWLCRQRSDYFPLTLGVGIAIFALAFVSLSWSLDRTDGIGLLVGFVSGLTIWAFQELTFYLGYVTGPRRKRCRQGCSGWRHWLHALEASLFHEISIVLTFVVLLGMSWGADNQIAILTFSLIWLMHQSARINVMLGVRNVNAEWLPKHLDFLHSFLRQAPPTAFFLVSVSCISLLFIVQLDLLASLPTGESGRGTVTLLTTLTGLALIEHICLVAPLPLTALWRIFGAPEPDIHNSVAKHAGGTHEV